jgi:hypothetical protein
MKKITVLLTILVSISLFTFAKKDTNAWKSEKNLNNQYSVFKENLNFWNGSFFMEETQLNQFYGSITDSISALRKEVLDIENQREAQQSRLNSKIKEAQETQIKLDESIKHQNSILVFGMNINKSVYSITMYIFILGVLVLAGIVFLLFIRSNKITIHTKKEYNELKEEFEVHKKNALDRYVKINTELTKTTRELNKK